MTTRVQWQEIEHWQASSPCSSNQGGSNFWDSCKQLSGQTEAYA